MQPRLPFRNRATEVSRVEAFSDATFGFAVTLIVVSLEVPQTFDDLIAVMRGLPGFAICFALLTWIWYCHYTFFRRYGLEDTFTIVLNTALLFVVLFYVYPLKFLFALLTGGLQSAIAPIRGAQSNSLMLIYGTGMAGIFLMLFGLYLHAYRKREELELNQVEVYDTVTYMIFHASYVGIALLSVAIALVGKPWHMHWAGWCYGLIGPVSAMIGAMRGTRRERLVTATVAT